MTGVMGSLAALEAMRAIAGFGEDTAGKLLLVDALAFRFRTTRPAQGPRLPRVRMTGLDYDLGARGTA